MSESVRRRVPPSATEPATTRRRLIGVAERLFAERGLDAVSLRAVGAAAGQRNNSAAQYHFGSRDGLVRAIIEARSAAIEQVRSDRVAELTASGRPPSVRDLVALFVVPLAEYVGPDPTWYLRFLTRVVEVAGVAHAPALIQPDGLRYMTDELRRALPGLSAATFQRRLRWLSEIGLRSLAEVERETAAGGAPRKGDVVEDLLTMLEALLLAPEPNPG